MIIPVAQIKATIFSLYIWTDMLKQIVVSGAVWSGFKLFATWVDHNLLNTSSDCKIDLLEFKD